MPKHVTQVGYLYSLGLSSPSWFIYCHQNCHRGDFGSCHGRCPSSSLRPYIFNKTQKWLTSIQNTNQESTDRYVTFCPWILVRRTSRKEQGHVTSELTGYMIFVSADEGKSNFPRKQIIRLGCILTSVDMTDINLTTNKVQIDYNMVRFNFLKW